MDPVSQMQQLVSYWTTLLPVSRKRRRDDSDESMTNTRAKTQAPSQTIAQIAPTRETPTNTASLGASS